MVAPCNDEQRSQASRQARNRARSGLTQLVNVIEGADACIHAASQRLRSGQLRFPGSSTSPRCSLSTVLQNNASGFKLITDGI